MKARFARDGGRRALVVDDVVQSVRVSDGEFGTGMWLNLLPDEAPRRSLILGLGGGTVVHLMQRRFGPTPIVGVEIDPDVVALGRIHFGLELPHLEVVVGDAFAYVATLAATSPAEPERFDYILVDAYVGGEMARASLSRPFLRDVRAIVTECGTVVFNFFHDRRLPSRLERLRQVFDTRRIIPFNLNVVVHCQR